LSEESLKRTGYFDVPAVQHWRQAFRAMRPRSPQRAGVEMGLVGVIGTQLWHHTYIDGNLADLPSALPSAVRRPLPVVAGRTEHVLTTDT
jgi:asparagine synthase (glutamine-hydrolysing)